MIDVHGLSFEVRGADTSLHFLVNIVYRSRRYQLYCVVTCMVNRMVDHGLHGQDAVHATGPALDGSSNQFRAGH